MEVGVRKTTGSCTTIQAKMWKIRPAPDTGPAQNSHSNETSLWNEKNKVIYYNMIYFAWFMFLHGIIIISHHFQVTQFIFLRLLRSLLLLGYLLNFLSQSFSSPLVMNIYSRTASNQLNMNVWLPFKVTIFRELVFLFYYISIIGFIC